MLEFKKITDFPRGTIYNILLDAYSYDARNKEIWENNWKETDEFFYENPEIAEKYGLVTCTMRYCSDCDKKEIFGQLIKRATYSCETYR